MKRTLLMITIILICITCRSSQLCSEYFCPTKEAACKSLDTKCSCSQQVLYCPTLSPNRIPFYYDEYDNSVTLAGLEFNWNITVNDVLKLWSTYFSSITRPNLLLTDFCNNIVTCNPKQFYSNSVDFDFGVFPIIPSIKMLGLNHNCIRNIRGNISSKLPQLQSVTLNGNYLTQIPSNVQLLQNLQNLSMVSNSISNLSRKVFTNLTQLQRLYLDKNCLSSLEPETFYDLYQLQYLTLSENNFRSLPQNLLDRNIYLEVLDLSFNQLEEISNGFFKGTLFLKTLKLGNNNLKSIHDGTFDDLKELKTLDLDSNQIISLPDDLFKFMFDLEILNLKNNSLTRVPIITFQKKKPGSILLQNNNITLLDIPITNRVINAEKLDLSFNCFQEIEFHDDTSYETGINHFICNRCCLKNNVMPNLLTGIGEIVDITCNSLSKLNLKAVNQMRSKYLSLLDVGNNSISEIIFDKESATKYNITDKILLIDLWNNPLNCDCKLIPLLDSIKFNTHLDKYKVKFDMDFVMCKTPIKLNGQFFNQLNRTSLCPFTENCPENCSCSIPLLKNYMLINCSDSGLTEFPIISQDIEIDIILDLQNNSISTLPKKESSIWYKLIDLNLSYNRIETTTNLTVTAKLNHIKLNNNLLTRREVSIENILMNSDQSRTITLSKNPWLCSCDLKQLRNKITKSQSRVLDLDNLVCESNGILYRFDQMDKFCPAPVPQISLTLKVAAPVCTFLIIIITVLAVISVRRQLEIKYFLFSKGWCLKWVCEEDLDSDKQYDAFVSYSSEDGEWVRDNLVANLEIESPTYKLCIHERDWLGGELIPEQIVRSVRESRRTLIILTEAFLKSEWSLLEFTVAYQQAVKDGIRRLIVIIPFGVPDLENVPDELRAYLSTTTYLEANKPHFLNKLRSSMPRLPSQIKNSCSA